VARAARPDDAALASLCVKQRRAQYFQAEGGYQSLAARDRHCQLEEGGASLSCLPTNYGYGNSKACRARS
jgi:hypothetical protein